MYLKSIVLLFAAIFSITTMTTAADNPANQSITNVTFASHVNFTLPMPVQDVYVILNDSTPDLVYRATPEQAKDPKILAKEAYATTNHTPQDPYMKSKNPVGPFPRGADLGFTLGEWLAAVGGGTYIEKGKNATIDFSFHRLVPNGTYTVWWAGVTPPPEYRYIVAPVGAPDGSENVFKADTAGNGTFHAEMKYLIPPSTNENRTLIVVRYQSDGKAPGPTPGAYGKIAHVQLLYRLPLPETVAATATQSAKKQPGFESIFALVGLLAATFIALRKR
jgi:PGF-CTERM motif